MSMGEGLWVAGHQIHRLRDGWGPELVAAFTDEMLCARHVSAAMVYGEGAGDDAWVEYSLEGPGPVVSQRLSLLGYTRAATMSFLDGLLDGSYLAWGIPSFLEEERQRQEAERTLLDTSTADDWIAAVAAGPDGLSPLTPGGFTWFLRLLDYTEPGFALQAALMAFPDAEVTFILDADDPDLVGENSELNNMCVDALDQVHQASAAHAPVIVLTEGSSDVAILEPALALLYPHLTDLVRFMNYANNAQGGAGSLATTVRAFAAAHVANPVIALFDNDTAAADALRPLYRDSALPSSIKVLRYPPIALATRYPTLGPPSEQAPDGRISAADVNGLAGSIELYLGEDVLVGSDGALRPVQWSSYSKGSKQYQGEITDKRDLQVAYQTKLAKARENPDIMNEQDWSGIRAILDMIIRVFD
ncbi:hypothetical protein ACIQU4_05250 [Streptomyces sp. NPDC090741]|uniref:hypothetical protein n=1 Tax=Streptomyces sp. NPDC090741 TaxID=3365967 RepID=UPI0038271B65